MEAPLSELPALARFAEELGYTDVWSLESNALDGFTPLAAVAAVTRTHPAPHRHHPGLDPAGLAPRHARSRMAELAPGCFVLGLGSSTEVVVQQWFDVPFSRPLTRTREAALAVRALLSGQRVRAMKLRRSPRARLPIYIAALGPKMLRLAGGSGGWCRLLPLRPSHNP